MGGLIPILILHHRVTEIHRDRKKWLGFQADLLYAAKRHLRFSGLLDTTLRPDWLQMQTEHTTVTTIKAVRMMQSQHYRYAFRHQCGTLRQGVLKDTVVS